MADRLCHECTHYGTSTYKDPCDECYLVKENGKKTKPNFNQRSVCLGRVYFKGEAEEFYNLNKEQESAVQHRAIQDNMSTWANYCVSR